ncbi:CMP-sialic acid transporter 4 [Vitis vinifera]|uniref:CMP-sialic acid transporter 4 n=1 Tax=Vitis vinifera TaxID=29760 RepID=A0A438JT09_VITVI|nr:CMP-sialic acid transporter 4 [Vitis vinifera]
MEYRKLKDLDKDDGAVGDDIESLRGKALSGAHTNNMATLGGHSIDRAKWKRKSIVTLALTVLTSSQAILIVWSKRAGKYEYSVTTANFLVETLKCALSLAALVRIWGNEGVTDDNRDSFEEGNLLFWDLIDRLSSSLDEVIVFPIPAALYLVKNLLQYYIFAYVDAPGYQILKNLNIISTGVLYRIILKKKLSEIQWAAFILLCAGCTTAQLNPSSDHVLQAPFQGWMMAIVMALLSGFAGVYTEAIIKKRPSRNINVQNFWLYVFGMVFNAVAIVIQDFDAVMNKGFFHGYSLITVLMIVNHALSGIAVSMVMKYADNIVKLALPPFAGVFYLSGDAPHRTCFCISVWFSSLPRLLPRLNCCLCLNIFALHWKAAKMMTDVALPPSLPTREAVKIKDQLPFAASPTELFTKTPMA